MKHARVAYAGAVHDAVERDGQLLLADGSLVSQDAVVWLPPLKPVPQARPPRQAEQRRARPERELEDAPESGGFHKGNMPAFLQRK